MSVQRPKQDFPSFNFYPKDWLTGEATLAMSTEQLGAFIQLLAHSWNSTPPCTLPDDDRLLASMARLSLSKWRRIGGPVKAQFRKNPDGRLQNSRLFFVFSEAVSRKAVKSKAGQKGNAARWSEDRSAIADGSQCDRDATILRSPSTSTSTPVPIKPEEAVLQASSSLSGDEQIRIVTEALASVAPHLDADERTVSLWLRDYSDPWWIAAAILESQQWISTARSVGYVTGVLRGKSADGWPPEAFDLRGYVEYRLKHPWSEVAAKAAVLPMRTKL